MRTDSNIPQIDGWLRSINPFRLAVDMINAVPAMMDKGQIDLSLFCRRLEGELTFSE